MRNVADRFVEELKIHIFFFSNVFGFENPAIYEIIWKKYCRAGQATFENTAHAHWVLDT